MAKIFGHGKAGFLGPAGGLSVLSGKQLNDRVGITCVLKGKLESAFFRPIGAERILLLTLQVVRDECRRRLDCKRQLSGVVFDFDYGRRAI